MKNYPFCGAHFSINIIFFKINPLHPLPFQKCTWADFKNQTLMEKRAPLVLSVFFQFDFDPKTSIYFCKDINFCFILVHTQLGGVRNYYNIIYTTKKHHFTWMYIPNFLIDLFFFLFLLTTTYIYSTYLVFSLYTTFC